MSFDFQRGIPVPSKCDEALSIGDMSEKHACCPSYGRGNSIAHPSILQSKDNDAFPVIEDDSPEATSPETPGCRKRAKDDTSAVGHPSRQVDYLSYEWGEEEIWSSWRYIVSLGGEFPNRARLENASWRTWTKTKYDLRTVSPETLNWFKDYDVTWLYGPLRQADSRLRLTRTEPFSYTLSTSESPVKLNKKSALKKRNLSQDMLLRSLSERLLLKQPTVTVQAQGTRACSGPGDDRAHADYDAFTFSSPRSNLYTRSSKDPYVGASTRSSPSVERKRIHFNQQVEQYIAVTAPEDVGDDMDSVYYARDCDYNDELLMNISEAKRELLKRRVINKAAKMDSPIIAMLPSAMLKYGVDTLEPQEPAMRHTPSISCKLSICSSPPTESPTSSRETIPVFDNDDDVEAEDHVPHSKPGWRCRPLDAPDSGMNHSFSSGSLSDEPIEMRRTEFGMPVLYEDADLATLGFREGILGRVVGIVHIAGDIAHFIWNVVWRR